MVQASIDSLLLAKYRAFGGVTAGQSFEATQRQYYYLRSGSADKSLSTDAYMHLFFDNQGYAKGFTDMRERLLFIDESAATPVMNWSDAARIWSLTP
jgi:hypothetical protein